MYLKKEKIVYANVWEDPELNRQALRVGPDDVVISITSGGCNSLNLLLENPKRLISIDCNHAQLYLLELKKVAIERLDFESFRNLLGPRFFGKSDNVGPGARVAIYQSIRAGLSSETREFWDNHADAIETGIIYCGSVEKLFSFYAKLLSFFKKPSKYSQLFLSKSLDQQKSLQGLFPLTAIRFLNFLLLNRVVISLVKGRHSLKYIGHKLLPENFSRKVWHVVTEVPLRGNYFLSHILLGCYMDEQSVPPYLMAKNFSKLKNAINRLEIRFGTTQTLREILGANSVSCFNLSNVMEWMDPDTFSTLLSDVLFLAKERSRLCYRYTLADAQPIPVKFANQMHYDENLSKKLHFIDRAFMYESFHAYTVK